MGSALVLGVLFLFLTLILLGMLRGLGWDSLSRTKGGLLSKSGARAVVGGGFVVGLAYGLFVGSRSGSETWIWVSRGVIDGLVVACAGAFYLGFQQRKAMRESPAAEVAEAVDGDAEGVADVSVADDGAELPDVAPLDAAPPRPPIEAVQAVRAPPAGDDDQGGGPVL